jgi:N-acetylglutamate synthase-like GNAT family acetyltransferase
MSKPAPKINKRLSYFTKAMQPKDIYVWVPPDMDETSALGIFLSYIEFVTQPGVKRIDTTIYNDEFENFYGMEIEPKYDFTHSGDKFCSTNADGGVGKGYLVDTANDGDSITVMSIKKNAAGVISHVYALASLRVSASKNAIVIHTLCANQMLPKTGEGARLLKTIERAAEESGFKTMVLYAVDSAVQFYKDNGYRLVKDADSQETNYPSSTDEIPMQKNFKARKGWHKLKTHVSVMTMMARAKKSKNILKKHKKKKHPNWCFLNQEPCV